MKTFRTYCIISQQDTQRLLGLHNNDERFRFQAEPTRRYWQSVDGKLFVHVLNPENAEEIVKNDILENELILEVDSENKAESIMSIIQGGMLLKYPEPSLAELDFDVDELISEFNESIFNERWYYSKFKKLENFYFGNQVWA